ncbi:YdiY family protein [Shewanella sp. NIFS-20-20]|uniref:DUF481 domain-containing protein n=1 Tax=Shewanella sp. NIFS-20-20 TaxID=2853806 RepID=UPI003528BB42
MIRTIIMAMCCSVPMAAIAADANKTLSGSAELGGTLTTGNTDTSSIKGAVKLEHEIANWHNTYEANALYSKDTDVVTAERYFAGGQGDYALDDRSYLFINANYLKDPFTGYDYTITSAVGYGYTVFESQQTKFDVEIGPGYLYQRLDEEQSALLGKDTEQSWVAHGVINFETQLSESSTFSQRFIGDYGDKFEGRSETAITANIIGALAMKFAVVVRYNSEPLDDKKSTDTETNMTLLYSF